MKKVLILIAISLPITAAAKVCQLDWLEIWRDSGGLNYAKIAYTQFTNGELGGIWSVESDQSGESHVIMGVAQCASAADMGGNPQFSSSSSDNMKCHCKMMSPRVGSWSYIHGFESDIDCGLECAKYCANALADGNASML